jgi:ribosome recycling factor
MRKAVAHLADQLRGIRPGTVSPGFVESFRVGVGGGSVPLVRIASVAVQGDRIIVRPFDPRHVPAVVKSLTEAGLSAYALDPRTVAVGVPPVSGEQRAEMARHVRKLGEEAKVAVRIVRQDARKEVERTGRGSLRVVQEATDEAVDEIDRLVKAKVVEVGS